jgi:hypothetical protein
MLILIIGLVIYILTRNIPLPPSISNTTIVEDGNTFLPDIYTKARTMVGYSNIQNDVLLNPYAAPLRDQRIFNNNNVGVGIPINIATQGVDTTYRQVGMLTRLNGVQTILPLIGRPLMTNRNKWNFYSQSDQNNSVKLPITFKGKSGTSEYGCDDLSNGDTIYVEGYNDAFKVTMYDNAQQKYIPFL